MLSESYHLVVCKDFGFPLSSLFEQFVRKLKSAANVEKVKSGDRQQEQRFRLAVVEKVGVLVGFSRKSTDISEISSLFENAVLPQTLFIHDVDFAADDEVDVG